MNKTPEGQITMFENYSNINYKDGQIRVSEMSYISSKMSTWEEIFSGYNEIKVMTFSYSLPFISKVMKLYERGEVIVGFDHLVGKDLADLFALQEYSTNYICKNRYLQERIEDETLKFYVVNDLVSHQKVYLLKADSGKVRTILSSGNISEKAWSGEQIENYVVCDDISCYENYLQAYALLKELSTDKIAKDAKPIKEDKENVDKLPVFQKIKSEHAVVIHTDNIENDKEYVFHAQKLSKDWEARIKSVKIEPSIEGKILIDAHKLAVLLGSIKKEVKEKKEVQKINPQLVIDYENRSMTYNENLFNLNPDINLVKNDIANLVEYMNGFGSFTGDTFRLKTAYWKVMNYMFLSPFIAIFRYIAVQNGYDTRFFPMYMLIYGDSDAGKTKFIETTQKMMFGKIPRKVAKENFSNKPMASLKTEVKGCPIFIDEISTTYWKYARDIVKVDDFLVENHMINHPTFVLVSNEIKAVKPELSKRIICVNLDNRLNKTEAALNDRKIYNIRKSLGTSFYREYVRRMFVACDKLIGDIAEHNLHEHAGWFPDIFRVSSKVIMDIFDDLNISIPSELHEFSWFDYMGDSAIGEKATNIIVDIYNYNRSIIKTNYQKNELEIDFSFYDDKESKIKVNTLHDELPAELECKVIGSKVILKLDKTEELTNLKFKQSKWFWKRM